MNQIYFNDNSFQIKDEEIVSLAKIVVVMTQFPEMQILVRSHADCTNKNDYNLWLSERKTSIVVQYMTDNGIDPSRLSFYGFKEERLQYSLCNCRECSKSGFDDKGELEFIVKWK